MNEQTSLLAIEKEKEREKKERNVLAIARNMNNYIQRAECRIRAKNVAISLKFAKYPNIAFVLRLPKSVNTLRSFSNPSTCVHKRIRDFPWLSSKSPWISRNVYFHRGNVPAFSISTTISRPLGARPNL